MAQEIQVALTLTVSALVDTGASVSASCTLVGLARSTYYRIARGYHHYQPVRVVTPCRLRVQPAALTTEERGEIIDVLTDEIYAGKSVVQTYWAAFDAGKVTCSQRTFYRVAATQSLVGDRRRTRAAGTYSRRVPVVAATKVGDLWSWDITEFRGPTKDDKYYLYLVIDVFSRYPVGWRISYVQCKKRAVALFAQAFTVHGVPKVIHADNGSAMRSGALVEALERAGAVTSYSRPRVSDDNPFSESLFKTIKYDLTCPSRFESIHHARQWMAGFLGRYTMDHRHSGLGRQTPYAVQMGVADEVRIKRQQALDEYWGLHPERFRRRPVAPGLPEATGINTKRLSQTG